ncbi:uncharacterized protein BO95DRAFT_255658, partial [Aspergillus brunneoviolaceus CBS 621.78]
PSHHVVNKAHHPLDLTSSHLFHPVPPLRALICMPFTEKPVNRLGRNDRRIDPNAEKAHPFAHQQHPRVRIEAPLDHGGRSLTDTQILAHGKLVLQGSGPQPGRREGLPEQEVPQVVGRDGRVELGEVGRHEQAAAAVVDQVGDAAIQEEARGEGRGVGDGGEMAFDSWSEVGGHDEGEREDYELVDEGDDLGHCGACLEGLV